MTPFMKQVVLKELIGEAATWALAAHSRGFDNVRFCHPDKAHKQVLLTLLSMHSKQVLGLICKSAETGENILDLLQEELHVERRRIGSMTLKFGPPIYVLPFEGTGRGICGLTFKYILVIDDRL